MRVIRLILGALAIAVFLAGCEQGPEVIENTVTAEPQEASSKDFGTHVIYFNAITTDQLTPEVARTYNIARSSNRALLNVSISKKAENSPGIPVAGDVKVTANNLTGQLKNLSVRKIQEGEAIYYIGDVPVADSENLVFNVEVTPEGGSETLSLRFSRQFYTD